MDNNRNQYLKQLNKLSQKISKPSIRKPTFDHQNQPPPPPEHIQLNQQPQQQQQQPPVYNINKNDFRDVVQKLTGSPAHERFSTPPPVHHSKPQSSRLQRIRPPPLANFSNRPPPLLSGAVSFPSIPPLRNTVNPSNPIASNPTNFNPFVRSVSPLSPLPPFPTIHAAAESPVSAYMRCLQNSNTGIDSTQFPGFSPNWNTFGTARSQVMFPSRSPQQGALPSPPQFQLPSSPLPFGCLSPRSPHPLLSPGILFSPSSGGFSQLPVSPRVPISSPIWKSV